MNDDKLEIYIWNFQTSTANDRSGFFENLSLVYAGYIPSPYYCIAKWPNLVLVFIFDILINYCETNNYKYS